MQLEIRQAEFPGDKQVVLDLLRTNLPYIDHELRFDWLYMKNPSGRAVTYFAIDNDGMPVGLATVFPRTMWINGTVSLCGQVGDFAIDSHYRTLGPAVQLQKATFEVVTRLDFTFVYDCPPNERGMSTFVRLGMRPVARMHRYAKLLRTDRQISKRMKISAFSRPTSWAANFALRLAQKPRPAKGIQIVEHTTCFDEEFTDLDRRIGNCVGVRSRRFSEDLRWRYSEDPINHYRCLVARCAGELVGYVIYERCGTDCFLLDLSATNLDPVGVYLLDSVASFERSHSETIQASASFSHQEMIQVLRTCGFKYRSEGKMIVPFWSREAQNREPGFPNSWLFQTIDVSA